MKTTVGLAGYGNWAREAYVPALLDDGDVEIGAVAARSEETRRMAAERFGAGIELFSDPFRLVREADVDAVMIGLPSGLVSDVAIAAIDAGKHAWLEPPPPGDPRIAALLDLSGRSGLVLHADMELRYHPVVAAIAGLLGDRLGPALAVRVIQRCNWAMTWDEEAVERGAMASGLSIWYLDPVDALLDSEPRRVDVIGARPRFPRAVEAGSALVEYDGAVGEWAFNFRSPERLSLRLEVVALEGEAEADLMTGRYRYRAGSPDWVGAEAPPALPSYGFVGDAGVRRGLPERGPGRGRKPHGAGRPAARPRCRDGVRREREERGLSGGAGVSGRGTGSLGFVGACVGVVVNPVPTMRTIVRRRPVGWALLVIVLVYAAQGIVQAVWLDPADFGALDDAEWVGPARVASVIVAPIVAVPVLASFAAVFWVMSFLLGGRGPYCGLFTGLAFASVPSVFSLPISLVLPQLGLPGQALSGLAGLVIFAWTLVLTVFAVQENNGFSTGRAIAAVFIPLGVLFVLAFALVVFAIVIIVLAVSDGGGGWY